MPLNAVAFANPVMELIDILPNVASALSIANNVASDINLVKPKIDAVELDLNTNVKPKVSTIENGLDESLELIFKNADDLADNKILINAAQDSINAANVAIDAVDNKAMTALGNAGELFDRVANIFNLIATLGTAIRMEQIAANSVERDAQLQAQIDAVSDQITGINNKNIDQDNAINGLQDAINNLNDLLRDLEALQNSHFNSLYNELVGLRGALQGQLSTLQGQLGTLTELETQTQTQVSSGFANLPPQMKTAVCEALNSDCFEFPSIEGGDCDLQPVLTKLNSLQQTVSNISGAIGSGNGACGVNFAFGSLTDGLEALVCGRGGFNFNEALEDYFANNESVDLQPVIDKIEDKGNEVLDAIEEIETSKDFHISAFDKEIDRIQGTYLSFKCLDIKAEKFPKRKPNDQIDVYDLPNARTNITIAELAKIVLPKGNRYCYINPKETRLKTKLFQAYFESKDKGYAALRELYKLTDFNGKELPALGTSEKTEPRTVSKRTLRIQSAVLYNSESGEILKSWNANDFLIYATENPNSGYPVNIPE